MQRKQCPEKVSNHKQWEQLNIDHALRPLDYIQKTGKISSSVIDLQKPTESKLLETSFV